MTTRALLTGGLLLGWSPAGAQAVLKITRVPTTTPPADTIFVDGSFNGWNPHSAAAALTKKTDGTYQINLPLKPGCGRVQIHSGQLGNLGSEREQAAIGQPQSRLGTSRRNQ